MIDQTIFKKLRYHERLTNVIVTSFSIHIQILITVTYDKVIDYNLFQNMLLRLFINPAAVSFVPSHTLKVFLICENLINYFCNKFCESHT